MTTTYRNRILAALPEEERQELLAGIQLSKLPLRKVLIELNEPIDRVCFVEHGIVSIVSVFANGTAVETATIGPEGMVGLPLYFGVDQMSAQGFVQVTGEGWIVPKDQFLRVLAKSAALRTLLGRFTQALMTQLAQSSGCNRRHSIEERCARWLLMTADRAGDSFDLTQQFLSQMLGVRRASVTVAAGVLQKAGLIEYSRGRIRVVDRARLEEASCECYGIIRFEQERLMGGCAVPNPLAGLKTSEDGMTVTGPGDS